MKWQIFPIVALVHFLLLFFSSYFFFQPQLAGTRSRKLSLKEVSYIWMLVDGSLRWAVGIIVQ
jgi:hypothetical protein